MAYIIHKLIIIIFDIFFLEVEIVDSKLLEARNNYAKRALKMLFNGSQKTFQVKTTLCNK
jgi:hypothetical protein